MKLVRVVIAALLCLFLQGWTHGGYVGATYYISPSGNDTANGLTPATAWLSPNHTINCGDVILAAQSQSYASANFWRAKWGTVANCPSVSGVYFAQLKCSGPLMSCKIADTTLAGMIVDRSNWAVSGWATTSSSGPCFDATPSGSYQIHHVAFINVVAISCISAGVNTNPYFGDASAGVDQFAVVGAIVYNAAQGGNVCGSGISDANPIANTAGTGTHVYIAGVFSINNLVPAGCASGLNQDGNGVIFDTWTGYTGQGVIEQSMALYNGGIGFFPLRNTAANVYIQNVTSYGNIQFTSRDPAAVGAEILSNLNSSLTSVTGSIFQASLQTQNGAQIYGSWVNGGDATNVVSGNYIFGVGGNNTNSTFSPGFSYGSNTLATPNFVNTAMPVTPDCTGESTTTLCAADAGIVANFKPQAVGALTLGYQLPGPCAPNALYPVWLKGVVPSGVITKPCGL